MLSHTLAVLLSLANLAQAPTPYQEEIEDLLVAQLADDDPKIRINAATKLAELGPLGGFAAPQLWKASRLEYKRKKPNTDVVSACWRALEAIGPPAVNMLTKVLANEKNSDWDREYSARLLGSITYKHGAESIKEAIPALTAAAKKRNHAGMAALIALRNAKETATSAIPDLERMFRTAEGEWKLMIAQCLGSIDGPLNPLAEPYFDQLRRDLELIKAAQRNDMGAVRRAMKGGAHVNATSKCALGYWGSPGYTALIYASFNGNEEMVKLLLKSGADPNYKLDGQTALDFAKTEGVKELLK